MTSIEELKKWVETKSAEGYTQDQIKDALVKGGYTDDEINTVLNPSTSIPKTENTDFKEQTDYSKQETKSAEPITVSKSKKSNVWLFLIIGIIVIILIVVGILVFNASAKNPDNQTETNDNLQTSDSDLISSSVSDNKETDSDNSSQETTCKDNDLNCFIEKLNGCTPTVYQHTITMPALFVPFVIMESGLQYSIIGPIDDSGCKINIKQNVYDFYKNTEMTSEKYKQELMAMNMYNESTYKYPSDEEINAMIEQMKSTSEFIIGSESTCDFNSSQIQMLVTEFKNFEQEGNLEWSTDTSHSLYSNCDGNLFNTNNNLD